MVKETKHVTVKSRLKLDIKEITAEGTFEGILSPYGNVDGGGDVVEPGSYTKTLREGGPNRPLLWQHKTDTPIGQLTLFDQTDGLHCKGQLLMDDPDAQKAYRFLKARIVKGLSIGFESIKDAIEGGVRHLKEIKLYEGSIVTFPMNEMALVNSVKQAGADGEDGPSDFNAELAEVQLMDASYQMMSALRSCLAGCMYSGSPKEEILSMTGTIIQQFSEAYQSFLPDYLDLMDEMYGGMEMWAKARLEKKSGATHSVATKTAIKSNCDTITTATNNLLALVADEAAESTSEEKAAKPPKPEPIDDHSAAESLIEKIKALIPA